MGGSAPRVSCWRFPCSLGASVLSTRSRRPGLHASASYRPGRLPRIPIAPTMAGILRRDARARMGRWQEPRGRAPLAAGKSERVPAFATELVQLGVDVIVATGLRENEAVRRGTTTIRTRRLSSKILSSPGSCGAWRGRGALYGRCLQHLRCGRKKRPAPQGSSPLLTRAGILASRQPDPGFSRRCKARPGAGGDASPPVLVAEPGDLEPAFARAVRDGVGAHIFPPDPSPSSIVRQSLP